MGRILYLIVIGTIISLLPLGVSAQESPQFHNFDIEDGLLHSTITAITQDSKGFMWIGTKEGLHRFNGKSFKIFEATNQPNSLVTNQISTLFAPEGKDLVFIGCRERNFSIYDLKTGLFENIKIEDDSVGYEAQIQAFVQLDSVNFLIGLLRPFGLFYFNLNDKKLTKVDVKIDNYYGRYPRNLKQMYLRNGTEIWISTDIGILKSDTKFTSTQLIRKFNQVDLSDVRSVSCVGGDSMLVSTSKMIFLYDAKSLRVEDISPKHIGSIEILSHIQDGDGNVWIATASGLLQLNVKQKKFSQFSYSPLQKNSIPNNYINTLYASSRESIIWVGTQMGLSYFGLKANSFKHYLPLLENDQVIEDVFGLFQASDSSFWIYSKNNLYTSLSINNRFVRVDNTNKYYSTLANKRVYDIFEDSQKNLWFATSNGLILYNPKTHRTNTFLNRDDKISSTILNCITGIYFHRDTLWLSTGAGFCSFDLVQRKYVNYSNLFNTEIFKTFVDTRDIFYDPQGYVWVGVNLGGVYRYNLKNGNVKHFVFESNNKSSLSSNSFISFFNDSKNRLWVTTYYNGFNKYNGDDSSFTCYSRATGLPSNSIYGIMEDNGGNLWISSNKGISKFYPETGRFYNFDFFDGTYISEFNMYSYTKFGSDVMFFGGIGGVISFNPEEIQEIKEPPRFFVTDIFIQNNEVPVTSTILKNQSILFRNSIDLKYQKSTMSFDITLINYLHPNRSEFAWKLDNYDRDWNVSRPNQSYISYTNLPPGKYELYIKSTANNEDWSTEKSVLTINIIPPWWKTLWFRLLLIIVFVLSVPMVYSMRIYRLEKQKNLLNKLVREKTEELVTLNESLEESNAEIIAQNDELERHRNYLEELVDERTDQLKNALIKAEESNRLKSAILSNMSHEVRTPLNAIIGYSRILDDESISSQERQEYADIVQHSSLSLLSLMDNIIELSRFQSENFTINKDTILVNSFIERVVEEQVKLSKPIVNVIYGLTEGADFKIVTDEYKLKVTLSNLLSNSFKYTDNGYVKVGYLVISRDSLEKEYGVVFSSESDNYILFYVEDTGAGIPSERYELIFDLFTKGEDFGHKYYEGLGLGLPICKIVVEMQGGAVWLKSECLKGSTFYFVLPLIEEEEKF